MEYILLKLMNAIKLLPANKAHDLTVSLLKLNLLTNTKLTPSTKLKQTINGIDYTHPIGLAPGFDKNGEVIPALCKMGFSFLEIGAITPKGQKGNPRPSMFRLNEDRAVINRMGFNNLGVDKFMQNYSDKQHSGIPLGINIGKNKHTEDYVEDYVIMAEKLIGKVDWLTINVSSPNTPGLRDLQQVEILADIIDAVKKVKKSRSFSAKKDTQIWLKLSPDLAENNVIEIADLAEDKQLNAIIATNTTIDRNLSLVSKNQHEQGGLSGYPLFDKSLRVQKILATKLLGKVPIIASGGIHDVETLWTRLANGAHLVQLYTAMLWQGPFIAAKLATQLEEKMTTEGINNIKDIIGRDLP